MNAHYEVWKTYPLPLTWQLHCNGKIFEVWVSFSPITQIEFNSFKNNNSPFSDRCVLNHGCMKCHSSYNIFKLGWSINSEFGKLTQNYVNPFCFKKVQITSFFFGCVAIGESQGDERHLMLKFSCCWQQRKGVWKKISIGFNLPTDWLSVWQEKKNLWWS